MKKSFFFLTTLTACLAVSSCLVPKKKYDELARQKSLLENDKALCEETVKNLEAESLRLGKKIDSLGLVIESLQNDTSELAMALRKTQSNYEGLNATYQKLLSTHNKIMNYNASELEKLNKNLSQREMDVVKLQTELKERERRVSELEKLIADKDKAVKELKNKVASALINYKDKDLTVEMKNGKVYVSLAEQLLFKSGSTEVDTKGVEALKKLAVVLKDQHDISIMVEGHTDDVPMAKGTNGIKDNWDLSVLRATSITRILENGGVDPKNLIPAGHSQFLPVAEGKSEEARKQNRRTEIILSPNLSELYKLLDTTN
jgi:chemotaxis protein MotB